VALLVGVAGRNVTALGYMTQVCVCVGGGRGGGGGARESTTHN
jgi:hypothetical protein